MVARLHLSSIASISNGFTMIHRPVMPRVGFEPTTTVYVLAMDHTRQQANPLSHNDQIMCTVKKTIHLSKPCLSSKLPFPKNKNKFVVITM